MRDVAYVALGISVLFIALQFIGAWIDRRLDRASQQIAERDSDWRFAVPKGFQVPDGREQVGWPTIEVGVVAQEVLDEVRREAA